MKNSRQKFIPNGTSDDMISLLIRANFLLSYPNEKPIPKFNFLHSWVQPIGNLIGLAMSAVASLIPAGKMFALQKKLCLKLSAPLAFPFEAHSPYLNSAKQLIAQVQAKTGLKPAVLCLFEHLSVDEQQMKLNFELVNHALSALNYLHQKPRRSKFVLAIDSFALEHWGSIAESIYAGFMGSYHLGFDRLSTHRRGLSRLLLNKSISRKIPFRISRTLHRRIGLAMAHTGGIPATGRALYAAREYLYLLRQKRDRHIRPDEVLTNLKKLSPDFTAFQLGGLVGVQLQQSVWKMMEAWVVALLTGAWNFDPTSHTEPCINSGFLCTKARAALIACAQAMQVKQEIADNALADFAENFSRHVPERVRLFYLLAQRVVAKGTPVLLLPLNAGNPDNKAMTWCEPVVLMDYSDQQFTIFALKNGSMKECVLSVEAFAREFNRKSFH